jgi:glycosyltransferase involved in cell wall biosynthesis
MKRISVVVPTYKNTRFIDECINSIIESIGDSDSEVLVGIDCCEETTAHVQSKEYDQRVRFFLFEQNVGPYVIKNTLAEISDSENILFFDSDDIMRPNMVDDILERLNLFKIVRPMFINFFDGEDTSLIEKTTSHMFAEGVFGMNKSVFMSMNGFEPWRCAADTDFKIRLGKNLIMAGKTKSVSFFRRKHESNLTKSKETNFASETRRQYRKAIDEKTYFGPLPELKKEEFKEIKKKE